jgi:large subunit ribosomal protein L23
MRKNAYTIIKNRHNTEKSRVLEGLQHSNSSKSLKKCKKPKYVFIVDINANKHEIASSVEEAFKDKKVQVKSVNTIVNKPKQRRVRGKIGYTKSFKKAIVTLRDGDMLDDQV